MSGILNLEPELRVLACPGCFTTMNTTYERCPSCGIALSRADAAAAADAMAVVNRACADATYVGGLLGTLFGIIGGVLVVMVKTHITFLLLEGVHLSSAVVALYCACMVAALGMPLVLVLAALWWVRFSRLATADKDFPKAKKVVRVSAAVALLFDLAMAGITLWLRPF